MLQLGRIQVRKTKNRKVQMRLMWSIFDSAELHSTLGSQMGLKVGTRLTVWMLEAMMSDDGFNLTLKAVSHFIDSTSC